MTADPEIAAKNEKTYAKLPWRCLDQRRQWIEALNAGNNPFTPEVLEALK